VIKYHLKKLGKETNLKANKHQYLKTKEEIHSTKISLREDINQNKKQYQKLMDLLIHATVSITVKIITPPQ
jgi:hypothetical protein